jgi:pyruvate,water dikinase
MRKGAGIITDEGGVTCHAAIVSRELGIPCIINTKNASEILRDGDMIEFDAETGVITKIKDFIVDFSELKNSEISEVGGKALNLGKMFGDFNVPNGFCITSELFNRYVPKEIKERLLLLDLDDSDAVKRFSENVRHDIKKIKLSDEDKNIIMENFDELKSDDVAVRSSGTAEDLPGAAFAGQHDTYLYVKREQVIEKILDCFSSIYSTRAIYYRDMKKMSHDVAIAVIIQKMVDSEKSGVMYTKNPNTGVNEVIIEISHGVGEMIVSGKITPDTIKIKDSHIEYKKGSKNLLMNGEGILSNKNYDEKCLNNDEIKELLDIAKQLEELFVYPQDIEFAFFRGNIYLLQSRNLTTIKKK